MEQTIRKYTNVKVGYIVYTLSHAEEFRDEIYSIESNHERLTIYNYNIKRNRGGILFVKSTDELMNLLNADDFEDYVAMVYYTDINEDGTIKYKPRSAKKIWVEIYTGGEYDSEEFDKCNLWQQFLKNTGCPYKKSEDLYTAIKEGKVTFEQLQEWDKKDKNILYFYGDPTEIKVANGDSFVVELNCEYDYFEEGEESEKEEPDPKQTEADKPVTEAPTGSLPATEYNESHACNECAEKLPDPPSEVHIEDEKEDANDVEEIFKQWYVLDEDNTFHFCIIKKNKEKVYLRVVSRLDDWEQASFVVYDHYGNIIFKDWTCGSSKGSWMSMMKRIEALHESPTETIIEMKKDIFQEMISK